MSLQVATELAFVVISLGAVGVQCWALRRLLVPGALATRYVRRALRRTAACRLGCAGLYVSTGINALLVHWQVITVTFAAFCMVQCTWQINAWLDVRVRRAADLPPVLPDVGLTRA